MSLQVSQNKVKLHFGRALNPKTEEPEFQKLMNETMEKLLGKDNQVAVITHQVSYPSSEGKDIGIGTSNDINSGYTDFLKLLGFNTVVQGPAGKTKRVSPSPYESTFFSLNPVLINLDELTTDKWGKILDTAVVDELVKDNPNKNNAVDNRRVAYLDKNDRYHIQIKHEKALRKAFATFMTGDTPAVKALRVQMNEFYKKNRDEWLKQDAVYEVLANKVYGADHWHHWGTEGDFGYYVKTLAANTNRDIDIEEIQTREWGMDYLGANELLKKNAKNAEQDKNLYVNLKKGDKSAEARIKELIGDSEAILANPDKKFDPNDENTDLTKDHSGEFLCYVCSQFVTDKQPDETAAGYEKQGIATFADCQVAFSDRDEWANQELFLDGYKLGCPPDLFSKTGQAWGFPVLDPENTFNEDGTPGPAAKLLKTRYKRLFEKNKGGVRIDHVIGLVDPWVYPENNPAENKTTLVGGGRLFSSPEHDVLKKYSHIELSDLDETKSPDNELRVKPEAFKRPEVIDKYKKMINVILQAADEADIKNPQKAIMCEDLGTLTNPTIAVMKNLGLSGLRVPIWADPNDPAHFYRGKNIKNPDWAVLGAHDNTSQIEWVEGLGNLNARSAQINYLNNDMKLGLGKLDRDAVAKVSKTYPQSLIKYKAAEVFAAPTSKVQLAFFDLFGFKNHYNTPGTCTSKYFAELSANKAQGKYDEIHQNAIQSGKPENQAKAEAEAGKGEIIRYSDNWSLRVPNNPKEVYYKRVEEGKALNMPEVLAIAVQSKLNRLGKNSSKAVTQELQDLKTRLNKFASILKEKTTDKPE